MKYDIIKTENYLLVVDESEIKAGEFYLLIPELVVKMSRSGLPSMAIEWKKIIAHLPLNGSPILEGVDLLPPLEDDTESVALKHFHCWDVEQIENLGMTKAFSRWVDGYNKAKEKYNLTLEKILDLYIQETGYGMDMWSKEENAVMSVVAKIIQSLSQPKAPIGFERELVNIMGKGEPVTERNPQGHAQWVGTYILP